MNKIISDNLSIFVAWRWTDLVVSLGGIGLFLPDGYGSRQVSCAPIDKQRKMQVAPPRQGI